MKKINDIVLYDVIFNFLCDKKSYCLFTCVLLSEAKHHTFVICLFQYPDTVPCISISKPRGLGEDHLSE